MKSLLRNFIRFSYAILTYALYPVLIFFWILKGIFNNVYLDRMTQRFGFNYPDLRGGSVWIHAVSVGEVQATIPLVNQIKSRYPDKDIIITTVTPTGALQVKNIFHDTVHHSYIPFETPFTVKNFFNSIKPCIALIMETEIWPNLYNECGLRKIPLILVSARISLKSLANYKRFLPLFRETLSHGILIAAQSKIDAERFISLGADPNRTWVMGNIKFDFSLPKGTVKQGEIIKENSFNNRPIWIAASTHEGEEDIILDAHKEILKNINNMVLILAPRHPERFQKIKQKLSSDKWEYKSRSDFEKTHRKCEVFLIDTIGELLLFYAASDIAFVGGSLLPIGGHNLLEPASLGLPTISGPYTFNQKEMTNLLEEADALKIISDSRELANNIITFHSNRSESEVVGERAKAIVENNKGAISGLMRRLDDIFPEKQI